MMRWNVPPAIPDFAMTRQWMPSFRTRPEATSRLFCFPYAGSGASVFAAWQRHLPSAVELVALHLPGHEERLRESPFRCLDPLVDALISALAPCLDLPYAFYGHSMGGWVAFYLARRLRQARMKKPTHLFVGASRAPQTPSRHPVIHALGRDEFIAHVCERYSEIPAVILNDRDMLDIMIQMLQADFAVFETTEYRAGDPLDIPISAYAGDADQAVTPAEMEGWRVHTRSAFSLEVLPGDHFFLKSGARDLVGRMGRKLQSVGNGTQA